MYTLEVSHIVLAHSSLPHCFSSLMSKGICSLRCSHIMVWTRLFAHTFILFYFCLFFFSHSDVYLLVCSGSLSCCLTWFWPGLNCWTDGLAFVSRIFWWVHHHRNECKFPRFCCAKQTPPCLLDSWYGVLVVIHAWCWWWPNISLFLFVSSVP